jgi:hypothetical protein
MVRSVLAEVFVLASGTVQTQLVSEMTPAKIKEALADKKGTGCYEIQTGYSERGCFSTPYSRVVEQRAYRTKRYQPFTEADVTAELIAPGEVHLYAYPSRYQGIHNVVAVVVGPREGKGTDGVIQPLKSEEINTEYKNLLGATFEGKGMRAVFPLSVLNEHNEFRIVYEGNARASAVEFQIKMDAIR